MPLQFTVFISHVSEDESIAVALKHLIETVFLNAQVFVAGRDLTGGEVWVKEIRDQLRSARVILTIITPFSKVTPWVLFEAGVGFVDSRTIPVCADGMTVENLEPPLKLLQAREVSEDGIQRLILDIAKRAELREPHQFPGIREALDAIQEFLVVRGKSTVEVPQTERVAELVLGHNFLIEATITDPELSLKLRRARELIREAAIASIEKARPIYDVPSVAELSAMDRDELREVAECFNIPYPYGASLKLFALSDKIPADRNSRWKRMNVQKSIQEAEEDVQKFMKELSEKGQ